MSIYNVAEVRNVRATIFFFCSDVLKKNIKRKIPLRNFRNSNYFDDKKG